MSAVGDVEPAVEDEPVSFQQELGKGRIGRKYGRTSVRAGQRSGERER